MELESKSNIFLNKIYLESRLKKMAAILFSAFNYKIIDSTHNDVMIWKRFPAHN